MSDFKTRLVEEKQQLDDRKEKLGSFIGTDNFNGLPVLQQSLLRVQHHAMNTYSQCLNERLVDLG